MTQYTAESLDLSRLAPVPLVDADYATNLKARLTHFQALWNAARKLDPSLPPINTLALQTEPAVILAQEYQYADTLLRQLMNEIAADLRLATSQKAALDHLAATYHRTQRKLLVAADPVNGIAAVYESDAELRSRAQLAPEGLATFGLTPGGYIYKVRTAFADRIKSVTAINRGAGLVELRALGRAGDGTVSASLLAEIAGAFAAEDASQSTDILTVLGADVEPWTASLILSLLPGPDPDVVKAAAVEAVQAYGVAQHRLGAGLYGEAVTAAAHVGPVEKVRHAGGFTDRMPRPEAAPYLRSVRVVVEILK